MSNKKKAENHDLDKDTIYTRYLIPYLSQNFSEILESIQLEDKLEDKLLENDYKKQLEQLERNISQNLGN